MLAAAHSNIPRICSVENCVAPHVARGLCKQHYRKARESGALALAEPVNYPATCSADDCSKASTKRGYCEAHYRRMQKYGRLHAVRQAPGLPQARSDGYIDQLVDGTRKLQHIALAEKAVGKPLPKGAEVHHVNEIRSDNSPGNLVVCPNRSYHQLLHERQRALDACGNASWRKCVYCKQYDDIGNMSGGVRGKALNSFYHKPCATKRVMEGKARRGLQQSA